MIGIPLGLAFANASEWIVHKYVLHGLGRKRSSFWAYHWHQHHRNARRNDHRDPDYEQTVLRWNGQGKEVLGLAAAGVALAPLAPVAPFFYGTLVYSGINYYRKHRRAHLDSAWARTNLPWHYDHHMGPDQDANWCVTRPWFDRLMGTRKPYVGTERERRDRQRREARRAEAGAASEAALAAA